MENSKTLHEDFYTRLEDAFLDSGYSYLELEKIIGIPDSTLNSYVNYKRAATVENYAKVFSVDVTEMLDITHIKTTDELLSDIYSMLKSASKEEILIAHKILKGLLH